jgi:3-oxoacyl-[acyl-carrier protein] reductase
LLPFATSAIAPDVEVIEVAGDVTLPETRDALIAAAPQADILVNNAGGPPPGDFRDWDRDTWIRALDANMLTGIDLIRRTIDGMTERGFGRIVNITSGSVRFPIPVLGLSNGARAGLTNFVLGLVPSLAGKGVTINNLMPGPFDTERMRKLSGMRTNLPGRMGDPDDFGATCAFLCSAHAGYINGQNLLMDGGQNVGNF